MAVGVPETDVLAAADRVLARGERPTVERVRAELGRGSPARVGQLLEQWWDALAKRLAGETALPELPPAIAGAFRTLWREAMATATTVALDGLSAARRDLETERQTAVASAQQAADAQRRAEQRADAAEHARTVADARAGDLERVVAEQQTQLNELRAQRTALNEQAADAAQRADRLRSELTTLQHAHAEERRALQAHVSQVENRCAESVDRAREESKALAARIKQFERERADAALHLERFKADALQARIALERAATRELARADLLEAQLKRLVVPPRAAKRRSATASAAEPRASKTTRPATPPRRPRRTASSP